MLQQGNGPKGSTLNKQKYYRAKGNLLMKIGEGILSRELILSAYTLKFDEATYFFYRASVAFRACSRFRDAGECLAKCAHTFLTLKSFVEAAVLYTEAAEVFAKVDKSEAINCLDKSVSIYCDSGRFDTSGRLERQIAMLYFELQDWEEAIIHFRKAADFFEGEQIIEPCDACLEKAAICYIELSEFESASELYEKLAISCYRSNLRIFNCRTFLLQSLLCSMASVVHEDDPAGKKKYEKVRQKWKNYTEDFTMWLCSKEALLIDNLLNIRLAYNRVDFIDHVYYWDAIHPWSKHNIILIKAVLQEIDSELLRRATVDAKRQAKMVLKAERRKRIDEKRRALIEQGKDPGRYMKDSEKIEVDNVSDDEEELTAIDGIDFDEQAADALAEKNAHAVVFAAKSS